MDHFLHRNVPFDTYCLPELCSCVSVADTGRDKIDTIILFYIFWVVVVVEATAG